MAKRPLSSRASTTAEEEHNAAPRRWPTTITGHAEVDPTTLVPHPDNWRRHPSGQRAGVDASLDLLGWIDEIIVNTTTGFMLNGHARVEQALAHEEPLVPVKYVALSPEKERLALLIFDPLTSMAEGDSATLAALMEATPTEHDDLQVLYDMLAAEHGPSFSD